MLEKLKLTTPPMVSKKQQKCNELTQLFFCFHFINIAIWNATQVAANQHEFGTSASFGIGSQTGSDQTNDAIGEIARNGINDCSKFFQGYSHYKGDAVTTFGIGLISGAVLSRDDYEYARRNNIF